MPGPHQKRGRTLQKAFRIEGIEMENLETLIKEIKEEIEFERREIDKPALTLCQLIEELIKAVERLDKENRNIRQKTIENCKFLLENLGYHAAADQLTQLE